MDFISGAGATNVDLLYQGFDRLAGVGEELYCKDFSLQLGGGLPATLINLGRLGIDTRIATELSTDIFSEFAKAKFEENNVTPTNLYSGDKIQYFLLDRVVGRNLFLCIVEKKPLQAFLSIDCGMCGRCFVRDWYRCIQSLSD